MAASAPVALVDPAGVRGCAALAASAPTADSALRWEGAAAGGGDEAASAADQEYSCSPTAAAGCGSSAAGVVADVDQKSVPSAGFAASSQRVAHSLTAGSASSAAAIEVSADP